ncbi:hypothetical protein [Actinomadura madurae]|uniref:hypothetical protein n=1 Tax=Actinomadura madurae TaxID=1993 RepID=UPI0020D2238F|nr:hypothetical protein [Actinomadura madurae]MCP9949028.1 hypothetical protein [Actinomadura madurae]MCP9965797.1 hypothetical protein [Actinomadura madurae]MCP9978273.1 hypothetical protein [Actinomadura madurae]MCQ0010210.1 hypothetical protein [Actinomadura madurae]MCQ0014477.1 hypothetical protein [Actinomadura madurae]
MDTHPRPLKRSLTLRSVVLFGLAYMTPLIVLGTFGVVATTTNGVVPTAYLLALVAMLFTAYSYGRMAAAYPVAARRTRTYGARSSLASASSWAGPRYWTTSSCRWSSG